MAIEKVVEFENGTVANYHKISAIHVSPYEIHSAEPIYDNNGNETGEYKDELRKGYYVIPVVLVPKRWFSGDFVILYCSKEDEESAYICEKYKYYKGVSSKFLGEIGGHKYADATQYELYDNVNEAIDRATELEREDEERDRFNKEEKKRLRLLAREEKAKKKEEAEYKEYLRLKEKYER
jgi:hypothetical protein